MPCSDAMIPNITTASADQNVGDILKLFEERNFRSLPVVDKDGNFEGLFTMGVVLKNLLPTAAAIEDGVENLDFMISSAPGAAKRLKKLQQKTIGEVMNKDCITLEEDTNTWEAVRVMKTHGSPIPVLAKGSRKFVGMISTHSLMRELQRILAQMEAENALDD